MYDGIPRSSMRNETPPAPGLTIIGEHPFARTPAGKLKARIATAFPDHDTIVTVPGIHVTQRQAFIDHLETLTPLRPEEKEKAWSRAVDLIVVEGAIQIRPDPNNMALAFLADELLQRLLAKHRIRFLGVLNERVREAIKRRGELWRITPLPKTDAEMRAMIDSSRIGIGGREIYYYGELKGTRFLTFQELQGLGRLDDGELRSHLAEIALHLGRRNAAGNPEVAFFGTETGVSRADFTKKDFLAMDSVGLREAYGALVEKFRAAARPELLRDDPENLAWKNAMVAALIGRENELVTEGGLLGLSAEFFMRIEWLPGGRMEEGELVLDPVLDVAEAGGGPGEHLRDEKSRKFIMNFVREYGDLECVNVGRVIGSLSRRAAAPGRRGVYIAALKQRQNPAEIVTIIRLQKQGVREYLEQGLSLLDAMISAEEYTEYILDRRLGCRQLGMNLPVRVTAKKISEHYIPAKGAGYPIWTPYFEREYIRGIATDKLPPTLFESQGFAVKCAHLLGQAAAPNVIVGRCDRTGSPLFDDGDEVMIVDAEGMPHDIVVADHTGTFNDYASPLTEFALKYALPVTRRRSFLADMGSFSRAYCAAFEERLLRIQEDYRRRRKAYDSLFLHLPAQEPGSFAYRWKRVLARLDEANPSALAEMVRGHIGT
jgi:hypothetical protein